MPHGLCYICWVFCTHACFFIFIPCWGKNPTAAQMMVVMKTMCKTTTSIRRFVHQLTSLWRPLCLWFMLPLCYVILWVKHLCHSVIMIYLMLCTFLSLACVVVFCNLSCICETFSGAYICCTVLFVETGRDKFGTRARLTVGRKPS